MPRPLHLTQPLEEGRRGPCAPSPILVHSVTGDGSAKVLDLPHAPRVLPFWARDQRTVMDGIRSAEEAGSPSAEATSERSGSIALNTARGSSVFFARPSRARGPT